MSERRYSDAEVAAIFREATEGQKTGTSLARQDDGLTLAELHAIGREVGLAPDAVSRAALSLELRPLAASQTFMSLPIGVERTVTLDRRLSDDEWEALVGELRTTFRAKGRIGGTGNFREWSNGNLHAMLEPTPQGHRLRLSTVKGSARAQVLAGAGMLVTAASVWMATLLTSGAANTSAILGTTMLGMAGVALLSSALVQLPRWARLRGQQMDAIVNKAALPALPSGTP